MAFSLGTPGIRRRIVALGRIWIGLTIASAAAEPERTHASDPTAEPTLSSLAEIRGLSKEQADARGTVRVRGVVTRCSRYEIYIQDEITAIFVNPDRTHHPPTFVPGDFIEVTGTVAPGQFLPIINEKTLRFLDHRPVPRAIPAKYSDLASGNLDCFWVEVAGVIRSVTHRASGGLSCSLAMDGNILPVELWDENHFLPPQLVGAVVHMCGVAGGLKNNQRQLLQPMIWVVASGETYFVVTPAPPDLFSISSQPIATLLSSHTATYANPLSKITGSVLWVESPRKIFVRDSTDSLEAQLQADAELQIGDRVEIVGFAERGTTKPVLGDGFVRKIGHSAPPRPRATSVRRLLQRNDDADLVEIEAVLIDVARARQSIMFLVNADGTLFDATYTPRVEERISDLPMAGSRLAIVGVSHVDKRASTEDMRVNAVSFSIRLRSLDDVKVVSAPSWWTARRLGIAMGGLIVVLLLAGAWIGCLRRTVARQTRIIVTKTRSEATVEERDRIAREFHDSLEQSLAGAAMVLDAAASTLARDTDVASTHIDTARAILRHGLDDAQRAVLNLRNREFESGDFATALEHSLRSLITADKVVLVFEAKGEPPALDAVAENHVLRIAQESVTNALKHAKATTIRVTLDTTTDRAQLRIEDDGVGATAGELQPTAPGHFGLIGMRERAEKLQGTLTVDSKPSAGTTIQLEFHVGLSKGRSDPIMSPLA